MADYYDRYKGFRVNNYAIPVDFAEIGVSGSDIYVYFDSRTMRMDMLSYKYYGDSNYGWLILQANPSIPPYEYSIVDGTEIRIPYPLSSAIERYEKSVSEIVSKK